MTAEAWITLAGLVLTFIVAPLALVVIKVYQIEVEVKNIRDNHLPHIEKEIQDLKDRAWPSNG